MFWGKRRRATDAATNALRPVVGLVQHFHGTPSGFWRDEYVLGFIGFLISFHGTTAAGITLSQEDKGLLLFDVFTDLSNLNGLEIGREFTRLATSADKSEAFERGMDNAAACAFASLGKVTDYSEPIYTRAKEVARAQGHANNLGAVIAVMMQELWFEEIKRRFPAA